jgi:predicted DNA-binding protein YlxM (UPF0122 family)
MSDVMLFGVLEMPYEMAMASELSRRQFYDRVRDATKALRDQEAEIGMLQDVADTNAELYQHELLRTAKAEALLREIRGCINETRGTHAYDVVDRITAHLGGENNG